MGENATQLWTSPGSKAGRIPDEQLQDICLQGDPARTRILLIESDECNADLIREVLAEDDNYEVRAVATAFEALQALGIGMDGKVSEAGWQANLILFDLTLLSDDERNALSHTLASGHKWPPMIMLSGWPVSYVDSILERVDAAGVVTKPFDIQTLLESVHQVLRSQRHARDGS